MSDEEGQIVREKEREHKYQCIPNKKKQKNNKLEIIIIKCSLLKKTRIKKENRRTS